MFEIELPIEKGGVSYINSDSKQIDPDLIICAKPGYIRHTKFPYQCYYVHMNIHSGTLYETLINMPDFLTVDQSDRYNEIFTKLITHYNAHTESEEIILQSLILELINMLNKAVDI